MSSAAIDLAVIAYEARPTESGASTFLMQGERTIAIFVGAEHALEAAAVAELLNDEALAVYTVAEDFPP